MAWDAAIRETEAGGEPGRLYPAAGPDSAAIRFGANPSGGSARTNKTTTEPGPGHNANGPVAAERLRSLVDRIERLESERKDLGSDIKDIFKEAGSAGFDVKVLRQLIRIRKQEPAEVEEQETLLDVYRRALGM